MLAIFLLLFIVGLILTIKYFQEWDVPLGRESEEVRDELERWVLDQNPDDELPALDILLIELHTLHKLLRTTHTEGMTWLSEVLEEERQGLAARVAYLLRNSAPTE